MPDRSVETDSAWFENHPSVEIVSRDRSSEYAAAIRKRCTTLSRMLAFCIEQLRDRRLSKLKRALAGRAFTLCIDETGDRKKGKTTDYGASQYIGNIGKIANGMVSVNTSGVLDHITFPLLFKASKPHTRFCAQRYLQNQAGVGC